MSGEATKKQSLALTVKKLLASLLFWLLFSAAVAGFLFLAYPRAAVYPDKTVHPGDPFQTLLIIKNDGYLPIREIHYSLSLENIEFGKGNTLPQAYSGVDETLITGLAAGRSSTIPLKSFIDLLKQSFGIILPPKAVTSAAICIDLSYRSYLIPYTFTKRVRFKADMGSSGSYTWHEYHRNQ